jgi:hypothetical protein
VIIRAVDPAESYMRRMGSRPKRRSNRAIARWTAYTPVSYRPGEEPESSHPVRRTHQVDEERRRARHLALVSRLGQEFGPYFDAKARTLEQGGPLRFMISR